MNKELNRKLIQQAGFVTWPSGEVDWASNYNNEIHRLINLVVRDCIALSEPITRTKLIERYRLNKYLE